MPEIQRREFPEYDDPSYSESPEFLRIASDDDEPRVTPPMEDPATAIWNLPISVTDLEKLKAGYISEGMEEKWDFKAGEPDITNGRITLRISRSWTGIEHYLLHLQTVETDETVETEEPGPWIHSITWSQNIGKPRLTEEQAKINAIILCRCWLGCGFLMIPHMDESMMWVKREDFDTTEDYLREIAEGMDNEVLRLSEVGFKSNTGR
ncbi:Hypothetical protein D9617_28g065330 [Elsinoe fawcettii]|nr:Hypothetical protein D9617_28g065330 [Elsinoe fawcettii]